MNKDPDLNNKQNAALDHKIAELIAEGYSRQQAQEAAPIMLGFSDGDVIKADKDGQARHKKPD